MSSSKARHLVRSVAIGLASATAALGAVAPEPSPVKRRLEIVDRAIQFHGGESYTESTTRLEVCSRSGCFDIHARIDGGLYEFEVEGKVREVLRHVRLTNDSVEVWEEGEPVALTADRRAAYQDWVMARVYFCFLPFRLNDDSVYKHDQGLERWGERSLHKVKVTFEPGSSSDAQDQYLYWFDPDTARLEQFAYSFSGDPGGLRFRRAFNYRRVGGILFFDQENWGIEAPGLSVDAIAPGFLPKLRRVSTVELRNITVAPLED